MLTELETLFSDQTAARPVRTPFGVYSRDDAVRRKYPKELPSSERPVEAAVIVAIGRSRSLLLGPACRGVSAHGFGFTSHSKNEVNETARPWPSVVYVTVTCGHQIEKRPTGLH